MTQLTPLIQEDRLLAGKYRLGPILGSGGVATVYRARHIWTEREVAVKILDPSLPHFDRLRQGFLREARATVQLDHPNVVDVFDMGEDGWETVYMVMELLEGPTLRDILYEHGPLGLEDTLSILLPLIDALERAHDLGIVHRDFKPENIMLSPDAYGVGTPKLLDFGVAEVLQDARSGGLREGRDIIMGTPQYMAPEQARDQRRLIGPHTDVWGVGVVWYECLTGRPLFDGDSAEEILNAVCEAEIQLDAAPRSVAPILEAALRRPPQERIDSLSSLKARLAEIGFTMESTPPPSDALSTPPSSNAPAAGPNPTLAGLGPEALLPPAPVTLNLRSEPVSVPSRSNGLVAFAGLGLALAVAFAAWWTIRAPEERPTTTQAPPPVETTLVPAPVERPEVPASDLDLELRTEALPEEKRDSGASLADTAPATEESPSAGVEAPREAPAAEEPATTKPATTKPATTKPVTVEPAIAEPQLEKPAPPPEPPRDEPPTEEEAQSEAPAAAPRSPRSQRSYRKAPELVTEW
jgi:serine/threonine protein kinase